MPSGPLVLRDGLTPSFSAEQAAVCMACCEPVGARVLKTPKHYPCSQHLNSKEFLLPRRQRGMRE